MRAARLFAAVLVLFPGPSVGQSLRALRQEVPARPMLMRGFALPATSALSLRTASLNLLSGPIQVSLRPPVVVPAAIPAPTLALQAAPMAVAASAEAIPAQLRGFGYAQERREASAAAATGLANALQAEKGDIAAARPILNRFYDRGLAAQGGDVLASDIIPRAGLAAADSSSRAPGASHDIPAPAEGSRRSAPFLLLQAAFAGAIAVPVVIGWLNPWLGVAVLSAGGLSAWAADRFLSKGKWDVGGKLKELAILSKDLTKSMAGVLFLAPLLAAVLAPTLGRALALLGMDPSAAAPILAVDMGGLPLAKALALDPIAGLFNGVIVASMLGATLVFTIPFAFGMLQAQDKPPFAKGLAAGLTTIAPGALIGGLAMGLSLAQAAVFLLPTAGLSAILFAALLLKPDPTVRLILRFGNWVQMVSYAGLALGLAAPVAGLAFGWTLGTAPVLETFGIIGIVVLVMAAAVPAVELALRWLGGKLRALGARVGINEFAAAGLVSSLVAIAPMLALFPRMDSRGKILNAAFAVSAAWILADHLGFVLAMEPASVPPMLLAKVFAGLLSLPAAWWIFGGADSAKRAD